MNVHRTSEFSFKLPPFAGNIPLKIKADELEGELALKHAGASVDIAFENLGIDPVWVTDDREKDFLKRKVKLDSNTRILVYSGSVFELIVRGRSDEFLYVKGLNPNVLCTIRFSKTESLPKDLECVLYAFRNPTPWL